MSLTLQMALATVLGIFTGLFLGDISHVFAPWASAYIMILKITIIPYLIGALIHGIGGLHSAQAKQILKKGLLFIALAWVINLSMVYLINFSFPHARGSDISSYMARELPKINFAELLIPENIFYALTHNIVPAIVIFSVLVGLALMHLKEKSQTMSTLQTFVEALARITHWISRITPFGTFIIIAGQVGTTQLSAIKQVSTYIILYILGICIVIFWIFPRLTSMLTTISSFRWLKQLLPILLLAYTTNIVIVCLPFIMELILRETQMLYPGDEKAQSPIQGIVSVVFNLPLGSIFIIVFVLFSALFYNTALSLANQLQLVLITFLTSLGAVGIGSWVNSLTFLLDSLGIPLDALNMYLTTVPFTAGFQSMVSAMEIATLSLLITLACRRLIVFQWGKIVKSCVITAIPIFLLFAGVQFFNPLPEIKNQPITICDLQIRSDVSATIHTRGLPPPLSSQEDTFNRILQTKTLRVGYHPNVPPFSFYNSNGVLVGYDISFAYELAHDLNCALELVPMDYGNLAKELDANLYDIGMSAITINSDRLKTIYFTRPYLEGKIVFVVKDKQRKKWKSRKEIEEDPNLRIAVLKGSSFETLARELFPAKEIVLLDTYGAFINLKSNNALLWEEQEAISWVTRHPHFYIIFPKPALGVDVLGYATRANTDRFLWFLDQWLHLKENEGFSEAQRDLWILGKTQTAAPQEPRWSILRDVLHWTK
jgi:proton glutamate symport protein